MQISHRSAHHELSLTSAAIAIAVALIVIPATARALATFASRLRDPTSTTITRWLGVPIAHAATAHTAQLLIRSHTMPVHVTAGASVTLTLGFKNVGEWAWQRGTGTTAILERTERNGPSVLMANSWVDTMRATFQQDDTIAPGAIAFFTAEFRAPLEPGTYTDRFILRTLDGTMLVGSDTDVTITVIAPVGSSALASEPTPGAALGLWGSSAPSAMGTDGTPDPAFIPFVPRYPSEPTMRIGIAYHEPTDAQWEPHRIRSSSAIRVATERGQEVVRIPAETTANVDYRPSTATYHLRVDMDWYTLDQPIRFTAEDSAMPIELASYTAPRRGNGDTVDRTFHGTIEVRFVPETERLWVVNELGMEAYLRGLVESHDHAPLEFHKAQAVAARTFALYHLERGGKYKRGQFILRNDARDQVYRGAATAARRPNFTRAVEETRGVIATFDGATAVTPYFAQSDGRTRAWHEVWHGQPKAWLTSVVDSPCEGRRLIGHGVGMSQRCAMVLAAQGWNFPMILKNYYQGVELRKVYE